MILTNNVKIMRGFICYSGESHSNNHSEFLHELSQKELNGKIVNAYYGKHPSGIHH